MRTRRLAGILALAGAGLIAAAAPAFAHVKIDPSVAQKGGDGVLTFRVPNESDTADVVKVDIQLPKDHPIGTVDSGQVPGWTAQLVTSKLTTPISTDDGEVSEVVSEIIWTGGKIGPGEFGQFPMLVDGLPDDTDSLTFPTVQTYSDGTVVSWIETTPPGGAEPEHPAPVVTLTAAADEGGSTGTTVVKKQTSGLAIVALVAAAAALVVAGFGLVRKPRTTA